MYEALYVKSRIRPLRALEGPFPSGTLKALETYFKSCNLGLAAFGKASSY